MVQVSLQADFESDRAHYDLSDDFFRCCLDPSMAYSCAYFAGGDESLAEAQRAKIDRSLGALELKPGERLLEIGCGWGATARRARERFGVQVVGLTLSLNHSAYTRALLRGDAAVEIRVEGWETYEGQCDKIIGLGSFEQVTRRKFAAFFAKCRSLLPEDGMLFLQTITLGKPTKSLAFARHTRFMVNDVFPKSEIPNPEELVQHGRQQGLELVRMESLRLHYARTLESWAENLDRNREAAIAAKNVETYEKFMRYFTASAKYFRSGEADCHEFLMKVF